MKVQAGAEHRAGVDGAGDVKVAHSEVAEVYAVAQIVVEVAAQTGGEPVDGQAGVEYQPSGIGPVGLEHEHLTG